MSSQKQSRFPLYRPEDEHDGCGVGFLADVSGKARVDVLPRALSALESLMHRGAVGADARTGDGAGIMLGLPEEFFASWLEETTGREVKGQVGVGFFFWPRRSPQMQRKGRRVVEALVRARGWKHFAWRVVPTRPGVLGVKAASTRPCLEQLVVDVPSKEGQGRLEVDRQLYSVRRSFERWVRLGSAEGYVASFSCRTIVYKGLMMADAVGGFYPDLEEGWATNFAIFHQRFSTNTFPAWRLAQPCRMLGHNGEINTILGNANGTDVRETELETEVFTAQEMEHLRPVLDRTMSDSALLDQVVELLSLTGRSVTHVMPMLIPEAWEGDEGMAAEVKAFYAFHACLNEPWDGPAAVVYSDGDVVGAHLDRNGLRPLRYQRTRDGLLCVSSEVGVLDVSPDQIIERGRLGPGHMLAVDLERGTLLTGDRIKGLLAARAPYGEWLSNLERLEPLKAADVVDEMAGQGVGAQEVVGADEKSEDEEAFLRRQLLYGYSREELKFLFEPMTKEGVEPMSSMGNDAPISVLSKLPKLLPTYFKQRFAQVTNPPIDPIREAGVMSLSVHLGRRRNWLSEGPEHAAQIELSGPILKANEMARLRNVAKRRGLVDLDMLFNVVDGKAGLALALDQLCAEAERAVDEGAEILVLTDRRANKDHCPMPVLLALGVVSTHLLRVGKRLRTSLVIESGEPRDVHHMATLIGYGAGAIYPYLAYEVIASECGEEACEAVDKYVATLEKGLLKIMSKMGISVLGSYRGAQIFEAVGLSQEVIDRAFANTPSPLGGIGVEDLAADALRRHLRAYGPEQPGRLEDLGFYRYRRGGELHAWGPKLLGAMNKFRKQKDGAYDAFRAATRGEGPLQLRDLLGIRELGEPLKIEEVEPVEAIRRRFVTAAMSLGSLSPEAHRDLAIAMNRIGGKSNTGEGGEDRARYARDADGISSEAAIKQVASARFGVNAEYLARAKELEIKMAQGSKPGEGGQLPGHKVSKYIAELRSATPGVPLISPPPHHDIYSIEDLAQLIYDLKVINPGADICVKLVSESGVGTIAAGVAKAYADVILISGHDGGTGASPLSSIKNAGNCWEIGLAEAQQVLRRNGLRERVKLRVDGGLKTGRDVVVGALLGAEEFNFGTAALVALGCRYVRQCHLDTCPVGIATQRGELREKYEGDPENLVRFFTSVAEEVREILAGMGARSLDEVIGRADLLVPMAEKLKRELAMTGALALDLTPLTAAEGDGAAFQTWPYNQRPECGLNDQIVDDTAAALAAGQSFEGRYGLTNGDRTIGARLAGLIARREGPKGLKDDTVRLRFEGVAGQSFGAFACGGMTLVLDGEANDYVAKGLSGGRVVVRHPFPGDRGFHGDILVGNTVLYGATGGELFVNGAAGERFAVRNSGAMAVVESVGDHGCEYMTNGVVVVLGRTGRNFGAGMTGGKAFVFDPDGRLKSRYHEEYLALRRLEGGDDEVMLKALLSKHVEWTRSLVGAEILEKWSEVREAFWVGVPRALLAVEEEVAVG